MFIDNRIYKAEVFLQNLTSKAPLHYQVLFRLLISLLL